MNKQRTDAEIRERYNTDEMIRRHGYDDYGYPKLDMDPEITGKGVSGRIQGEMGRMIWTGRLLSVADSFSWFLLVGVAIFWPFVVLEILARRRHKQECADEVVRWRALRQRAHTKKGGE